MNHFFIVSLSLVSSICPFATVRQYYDSMQLWDPSNLSLPLHRLWWPFNFATRKNLAFIPAAETNYIFVDLFRAIQPTIHLPIFPAHSGHRSGRAICCNQSSHKYARSHHTGPTGGEQPIGSQLSLCQPMRGKQGTREPGNQVAMCGLVGHQGTREPGGNVWACRSSPIFYPDASKTFFTCGTTQFSNLPALPSAKLKMSRKKEHGSN